MHDDDPLPHPAPQAAGLVRGFLIAGAVAVALFAAGMASQLASLFETRLLRRDAELSQAFVQSLAETQRVLGTLDSPPERAPGFLEFAEHLAALPDVLTVNLYLPDGSVRWSSQPALIGRRFGDNDELDEAVQGEVVAHFSSDTQGKAEHLWLGLAPREFVENYLPVRDPAGRVQAVVELYRRPVALTEALNDGLRRIWLGAGVGGGLLIAALVWFVRRIDRALRAQQARLVDSEALAIAGELASAVAHNIRNPLGSIRSAAELQRELPDTPMVPDEVIREVDRIEHLVRTLLSTARDAQHRPARCDAALALEATRRRFEPVLQGRQQQLQSDWPAGLGEVPMDEVLLAQTLASVLANALEAGAAGDTVSLRGEVRGRWIELHVEDEGPGIPADLRPRIAEPFFTTKAGGLGLGLSLARRAVGRCGGTLLLQDRTPRGLRVTLRLPRLDPAH